VLTLIQAARKEDGFFADLLEATFYAGARAPGELAQLDARHFDAMRGQITIIDGKTGHRGTSSCRARTAIAGARAGNTAR
jgi:hypothetical protein